MNKKFAISIWVATVTLLCGCGNQTKIAALEKRVAELEQRQLAAQERELAFDEALNKLANEKAHWDGKVQDEFTGLIRIVSAHTEFIKGLQDADSQRLAAELRKVSK